MNRTHPALLLASLLVAACRFDGAGFASDDEVGIDGAAGGADAPVEHDAMPDPDDPDATPLDAPMAATPGVLHARPAGGAVTLDGNDLEFVAAGVDFASFDLVDGELVELLDGYTGSSAHVRFGAMHDATYLYFFAAVTDSVHQVDSEAVWNDDGVVFYLDGDHDALGAIGDDDHAVVVRGDGMWQDYGPGTDPTLDGLRLLVDGGYHLEIRISKASLSATIGAALGFDLALTDDDGWVDSDYDGYGLWFKSSRAECQSCCSGSGPSDPYCDTTLYGTLALD